MNTENLTDAFEMIETANETMAAGFKTLRELLQEKMESGGASEAAAFEITVNGTSNIFVSPDDERLNQAVNPVGVEIRKVNTATAGV